jgi:hypothetical protein
MQPWHSRRSGAPGDVLKKLPGKSGVEYDPEYLLQENAAPFNETQ